MNSQITDSTGYFDPFDYCVTYDMATATPNNSAVIIKKSVTRILSILRFWYHSIENGYLHLPSKRFSENHKNESVINIFNFRKKRKWLGVCPAASKRSVTTDAALKEAHLHSPGHRDKQEKRNYSVTLLLLFTSLALTHIRLLASRAKRASSASELKTW